MESPPRRRQQSLDWPREPMLSPFIFLVSPFLARAPAHGTNPGQRGAVGHFHALRASSGERVRSTLIPHRDKTMHRSGATGFWGFPPESLEFSMRFQGKRLPCFWFSASFPGAPFSILTLLLCSSIFWSVASRWRWRERSTSCLSS